MQVHIRKETAGHASSGYHWPDDGDVIPVDPEHAAELLRIPDGDFTVVDPDSDGDASDDGEDDVMDEVDRTPDDATDRPVKRRPGRPRKT